MYIFILLRGNEEFRSAFLKQFANEIEPYVYELTYHSPGCGCADANYINTLEFDLNSDDKSDALEYWKTSIVHRVIAIPQ